MVFSPKFPPPPLGHCPTPAPSERRAVGAAFLGHRPLTPGHFCPTCPHVKNKEFLRRLRRHGVELIEGKGKGGHVWAIHNGMKTTIPVHGGRDMDPDFLKDICKQLGLAPKDVL
ncbi:addiction module toxin, HicA family [Desulfolutivibrio sulfoxidireducens]|nr:addiction module toxin, HicA family [Desulfolutivibrio sulfoxidireducens]